MSRLSLLVDQLAFVILDYYQMKPPYTNLHSSFFTQDNVPEKMALLSSCVKDIGDSSYNDRFTLMDYILEHYLLLKPFMHQSNETLCPLPEELDTHVEELLKTLHQLIETPQENHISVPFKDKKFALKGFSRSSSMFGDQLALSGQLISKFLLYHNLNPSNIKTKVAELFAQHTAELSEKTERVPAVRAQREKSTALAEANTLLISSKSSLETEHASLREQQQSLKEKNALLTSEKTDFISTCKRQKETITELEEANRTLTEKLEGLQKDKDYLTHENSEMKEQIRALKKSLKLSERHSKPEESLNDAAGTSLPTERTTPTTIQRTYPSIASIFTGSAWGMQPSLGLRFFTPIAQTALPPEPERPLTGIHSIFDSILN